MKIGIDISQTAFKGTGVARYMTSLVKALIEYDTKNEYVFFYSSLRTPIDPKLQSLIRKPHVLKSYRIPPTLLSFLWNTLHIAPIEKFVGNVDIFMTSDWTEPPAQSAIKITTIHDMIVYTHQHTTTQSTSVKLSHLRISANIAATQRRRHRHIVHESAGIFVDSLHTAHDVKKYLHINDERIHLLYPPFEVASHAAQWKTVAKKYAISRPYILTVGKLEPRKNIPALVDAFGAARLNNTQLLVVGSTGWGENMQHLSHDSVKFLGYVSDEELAALYTHALCFVFPSLYEGFGYPLIEAMAHKCPIATSRTSSLTEIAQNAALLFDPKSTADMSSAIIRLASNQKLRTSLIKKGSARYKDFSPEIFAKNFVRIVSSIYNDHRN
ncbi:MAG: Mannosylfructose-phosphate synthase [Microgenomates bacterium OLB23]|nr:MAG: Mannosylfructose-phosphate synthase [Microgenomates bacterium OLB23]